MEVNLKEGRQEVAVGGGSSDFILHIYEQLSIFPG
jgi:hypothetical protein